MYCGIRRKAIQVGYRRQQVDAPVLDRYKCKSEAPPQCTDVNYSIDLYTEMLQMFSVKISEYDYTLVVKITIKVIQTKKYWDPNLDLT